MQCNPKHTASNESTKMSAKHFKTTTTPKIRQQQTAVVRRESEAKHELAARHHEGIAKYEAEQVRESESLRIIAKAVQLAIRQAG